MINVGILGGSGYTGVELLTLLHPHEKANVSVISSRQFEKQTVASVFPNLAKAYPSLLFSSPDLANFIECDVVFVAAPNGIAMTVADELLSRGIVVIDLSADFRLKDKDQWAHHYGQEHSAPHLIGSAVYGLPELNREAIKTANLIANPGCYPTSVALGYWPLLANNLIDITTLISDSKSGVSGAGRHPVLPLLQAESVESFKAYKASGHRHQPEIVQTLQQMIASKPDNQSAEKMSLVFVPHLVPMVRGIHSTLYAKLTDSDSDSDIDLNGLFKDFYAHEPFVHVLDSGSHPETKNVRTTNDVQISVHKQASQVIVLVVEDNLVKGAAGQAIQNMNIRFGVDEQMGLNLLARHA